ncbi:MAG: hypothetical protein ACSHYF_05220 [Verrucomicrobiaceae bacterium]
MSEEPPEEKPSGRLRAEDRRGRSLEMFQGDRLRSEKATQRAVEKAEEADPEEGWKDERSGGWRWRVMVVAALLVLVGVTAAVVNYVVIPRQEREARESLDAGKLFSETASVEEVKAEVERVVRGFMEAKSHEERCQYVVGGRWMLGKMEEYYGRPGAKTPNGFGEVLESLPASFRGLAMEAVIAMEADGKSGWVYNLLPGRDGMLIDWEASVALSEMDWEEFCKLKPREKKMMRVYVSRAQYQPGLPAEGEHGFCMVTTRGSELSFPGYFRRDSEVAPKLKEIVPARASQPVTLGLRWNAEGTAIEVVELKHNFWIDVAAYEGFLGMELVKED